MTSKVKILCDKIESLMAVYRDNNHDLLYDKTMIELYSMNYSGLFIKLTNLPLFRFRLNEENNKLFYKTNDIYYAPQKYVCSYGRVNTPRQSMFYCSESPKICSLELLYDYLLKNDVGHEHYATCSEWEIKKELNLLIVAIAPLKREYVNGFTLRDECFKFVKSEPKATKETYSNLYSLTEHFYLMNAKSDYSVYVVCSAIANFLTLQFPNIDGFIYPTVQGNTGYNIVLRPHALDNKMIVPKTTVIMEKWIVANKNHMKVDSNFNKIGHVNAENIVWGD